MHVAWDRLSVCLGAWDIIIDNIGEEWQLQLNLELSPRCKITFYRVKRNNSNIISSRLIFELSSLFSFNVLGNPPTTPAQNTQRDCPSQICMYLVYRIKVFREGRAITADLFFHWICWGAGDGWWAQAYKKHYMWHVGNLMDQSMTNINSDKLLSLSLINVPCVYDWF